MINIKCKTVNQFKLLQHVKENFIADAEITIELINDNEILVKHKSGEYCFLEMVNGKVEEEFHLR